MFFVFGGCFLATEEKKKPESRKYTIKFIPDGDGTVKSIHLSARVMKYGAASLAVGAMLFVGAASYAVYSTLAAHSGAEEMGQLRQVNNIQQEQLLQLSKKASALQAQIDELSQVETELRQLTGAQPASGDGNGDAGDGSNGSQDGEHDGQGGPYPSYVNPDVDGVTAALDSVEKQLAQRRASLDDLRQQIIEQQDQANAGLPTPFGTNMAGSTMPSIWPASGTVTSPFGLRWGGSDFHPGMDIANDMGTPIMATANGTVTVAGWNSGGYGNMVDIDHGNGIMTRYGHASRVVVTPGQYVRRGQIIAYMGSTGFSTGPHVHYEVRVNGQAVNPINYLH